MAIRPVFIPCFDGQALADEVMVDFKWVPGLSVSQKLKNVHALHTAAQSKGIFPILEISTKSPRPVGVALSAFNLSVNIPEIGYLSVESAFQGSKVFEKGGPYTDYYSKTGREIRQDERLRNSGNLLFFNLGGDIWELSPPTAFYDWLFISALAQNPDLNKQLFEFKGFTDIEFNPEKSINCQARSAAIFISLSKQNRLTGALQSKEAYFIEILRSAKQPYSFNGPTQPRLF